MRLWAALTLLGLVACGKGGVQPGPNVDIILAAKPAPNLSDYGLFEEIASRSPAADVYAYDLINPLFSDYAEKDRYVYTPSPAGRPATDTAVFDFPVGTVLVKSFSYNNTAIETRLLIHKAEGWEAYPYVWNEEGTDATYSPVGAVRTISFTDPTGNLQAIDYRVPNRNQCKTCHQAGDAITPIGPAPRHLDHVGPYGQPQLADWVARGLIGEIPEHAPAAKVTDPTAPLEARARAYLDINCAHCHKADGAASNSGLWLTADETDPVKLGIGKHPTAAGRGAGQLDYVIAPGAPDASILAYRMASTEAGIAMPELGRALIDAEGVQLIEEWIAAMDTPPRR